MIEDEKTADNGIKAVHATLREPFLKIGGVLAVVLHPCFLFFYLFLGFYIIREGFTGGQKFWIEFVIVLSFSVLLPAFFPILYAKDAFLKDRKKRPYSLLFTLISYIICFILINKLNTAVDIYESNWNDLMIYYDTLLTLLILGLGLLFAVSFWFKISLHANGIGFLWAVLLKIDSQAGIAQHGFFILIQLLVFLCSCILLWQRVASGSHTRREVVAGLLSGLIISSVVGVLRLPPLFYHYRLW